MDLATLAQVCAWLRLSTETTDADLLSALITSQSAVIQNHLNRDLSLQTYTEVMDGNGKSFMPLQNWPVVNVSLVQIGREVIPQWIPEQPKLSWRLRGNPPDPQSIALFHGVFWKGFASTQITYSAGYTPESLPPDITQACCELIGIRYREMMRIGEKMRTDKTTGETVSFFTGSLPPSVVDALASYRRRWSYGSSV